MDDKAMDKNVAASRSRLIPVIGTIGENEKPSAAHAEAMPSPASTDAMREAVQALFQPWPKDEMGPSDEPESQYRFGYNTALEDVLEALAAPAPWIDWKWGDAPARGLIEIRCEDGSTNTVESDECLWDKGSAISGYRYIRDDRAAPAQSEEHADDIAIDSFARAMKAKMAESRAKGRRGWQTSNGRDLSRFLREHVEKGDPRDVANYCMMLWALCTPIDPAQSEVKPELFGQMIPPGAMMWFAAPDECADDLMAISVGGKMIAKSHREMDWQVSMPSVVPAQSDEGAKLMTPEAERRVYDFYTKHAIGPLVAPSCLVCGQSTQKRPVAITHGELPGIVVCLECRDSAARHAPTGDEK